MAQWGIGKSATLALVGCTLTSAALATMCTVHFGDVVACAPGQSCEDASAEAGAGTSCDADLDSAGEQCGACGHSCLGGACVGGQCQPVVLVSGQVYPYGIAIDDARVYWVAKGWDGGGAGVFAASKDGGDLRQLADADNPAFLSSDELALYWANEGDGSANGSIGRVNKDGTILGPLTFARLWPRGITVDPNFIYFTNESDAGGVLRLNKAGGNLEVVAALPHDGGYGAGDIVLDDASAHAYWVTEGNGVVGAVPLPPGTGPATVVASNQATPDGLATDGTKLFWTNIGGTAVEEMPTADAAALTTVIDGLSQPNGIALDPDFIYVTTFQSGRLYRIPRDGGSASYVSAGDGPIRIAVDEVSVYWTASGCVAGSCAGPGAIMRLAK
jgi:hypothetical protein